MSWLRDLLGGMSAPQETDSRMKPLGDMNALDDAIGNSNASPVFLFKHSTACPISSRAYEEVARYETVRGAADPPVYMVRVIEERPVSNAIASRLDVIHKSPQVILVDQGKAVWDASHHGIYVDRMQDAVKALGRPNPSS